VTFAETKTLGRPTGTAYGVEVSGYAIHHGVVSVSDLTAEPFLDGCRRGAVWGTSWHGTLENDQFRRAFLADVAAVARRDPARLGGGFLGPGRRGVVGRASQACVA
jgi:adenosylcobyric acid synthase